MEDCTMNDGIEKRRYNRHKANLTLNVSKLFNQDYINIRNLDSPINITDISKGGIGFRSKSILPLDFYFDAVLQLDDEKDPINCVVKIIHCQPVDNSDLYAYGCEFVGMSPVIGDTVDNYSSHTEPPQA